MWARLKAAFLAGPTVASLGKVHINLFLLVSLLWVGAATSVTVLLIGLGLEIAYLVWMMNSEYIKAPMAHAERIAEYISARDTLLKRISTEGRNRFQHLDSACSQLVEAGGIQYAARFDTLMELALVYLRLLVVRSELSNPKHSDDLQLKLIEVTGMRDKSSGAQKHSLEGTVELIERRIELMHEGSARINTVDAELIRLEQQVALLTEQAQLGPDPSALAEQVDAVVWTLEETSVWLDQNMMLEEI